MNFALLRLLDANANRAREALRVLEDYARMILNSAPLSAELKKLRHGLAAATAPFLEQAIPFRDTPGDVGTGNKTAAEQTRRDLPHVVTAAGKRLGEALRSLEEYAKIDYIDSARQLESLRYRFYDLEKQLAATLRPTRPFSSVRLCVLITESACRHPWFETARLAIDGGADCLQLREKSLDARELLDRAQALVSLCREHGVLCIINDRADIARLSDADGLHLGQTDLPLRQARQILAPGKLLGLSTHQISHAREAVEAGADYLGVGPIFKSSTKPRDICPGLDYARQVASEIPLPALGIAGITLDTAAAVRQTGLRGIAVTAAVTAAPDPAAAAQALRQAIDQPQPLD